MKDDSIQALTAKALARWGPDKFPNGTVWRVEGSFVSFHAFTYSHAVVKAAGRWYVTGPSQHSPNGRDWTSVVRWLDRFATVEVWVATDYEEFEPPAPSLPDGASPTALPPA